MRDMQWWTDQMVRFSAFICLARTQAHVSWERLARGLALAALLLTTAASTASTLTINGEVVPGVDVNRIVYNGSDLSLTLQNGSVGVVAATSIAPSAPEDPSAGLACVGEKIASDVVCDDDLETVNLEKTLSTSVQELFPGLTSSSEFMLDSTDTHVVLNFSVETGVVPSIEGHISAKPGGNPINAKCVFQIDGVGERFVVTFNVPGNPYKQSLCSVVLNEPHYINLTVTSDLAEGETVNVVRTVRAIAAN